MALILHGTNGITDVNGTAAAPAITGTDTDTGVFFGTNTVSLSTGGTERLQVDSSGNLGLGVTPSAWGSGFKAIDVNTYGSVASSSSAMRLFANSYNDGTNWTYKTTAAASRYDLSGGAHSWQIAPSGTAGNAITFTQAMTLDASGQLGLGAVPSAWSGGFKSLGILYGGIAATSAGSANTEVVHNTYYNGTNWIAQYTGGYGTRYAAGDGGHAWHTSSTTTTGGSSISFTQAMTLDTSGNLLQGTTSVGTMAGNTVHRLANTGVIARTSSSLANSGTLNIVVSSGGASFAGFLVVENVVLSNALIRTQTTYSVFGRGTTFTATSIASSNGSSGAASFTVTCPSTGVISVTNTSGNTTGVNMSFFGSEGF